MNEEALRAFVAQASTWRSYIRARVRVVLAVFTDGNWSVWHSYTAFMSEVPEKIDGFTLETASIRAFRDLRVFRDESDVDAAIAEIRDAPEVVKTAEWSLSLAPSAGHLQFDYE